MTTAYAELHCLSNYSFLRGASHPDELVARAVELGYDALALTDECSVAGVVRAHAAAKEHDLALIIGSEFCLDDGLRLVVLACNRHGYGSLCHMITQGRRAADKGQYHLRRESLSTLRDCLLIWLPGDEPNAEEGGWLARRFPGRVWIGVELLADGRERQRLQLLQELGDILQLPQVACGDVHMHRRGRRALQDTLTAIRLRTPVAALGDALYSNGERHLRSLATLARRYPAKLLEQSRVIAGRCQFSLDELRYEYPYELVPAGETPASHLRNLTEAGMAWRWPEGVPEKVVTQIENELQLISDLAYEPFFLTVQDIVTFARGRGILCQGRGSAANSAVCFCLGITEVDPARMSMLFERFISRERDEPPDIDVDFEHQRREEVIQYIYRKYTRERTALAATVVSYRPRSAMRDVGKALGLDQLQIEKLARTIQWWDGKVVDNERVVEAGFDPDSPQIRRLLALVRELIGFPRHLSQHVGGFVISQGPLAELVPVENATMPERTVIQWDKDDLEELGLLKVDVLGLGMLSAIRRAFDLIERFRGQRWTLATVPAEESRVYDMICRADTVGVFQIESRAQMVMLPRLRPRRYYDLVIEVAIVRPGPIQGDMVHPYLRRRNKEEPVTYPSEAVRKVLERTLGVPIFQEQVMQLAIVAAGFTPGESDQLRRAMAAWKRKGGLGPFEERLVSGMRERGYPEEFAHRLFQQILGFGEYGFPESHAASFSLLVYVSAWLKCHEPAAFTCALLNSQPMGFYAPAQLVQMARRHGVVIRPVDVTVSDWDCTLERGEDREPVLRLGLRMARGLPEEAALRLLEARQQKSFDSAQDLAERAALDRGDLASLAAADALQPLSGHRYRARWDVAGVEPPAALFPSLRIAEGLPLLPAPKLGQEVVADYRSTGLSLRAHPMALLRTRLQEMGWISCAELRELPNGAPAAVAGLVITRQRPGTASGVVFVTLEDESEQGNVVIWPKLLERQRREVLDARLLGVRGRVQREGEVLHLIAGRLEDHSAMLGRLQTRSRNFH